jgi:hypothetical protein
MAARLAKYLKLEISRSNFRPGRKPRFRCRCSKCEHRETFRGLPWMKRKVPQCPECGSRKWRVDWFRSTVETSRNKCECGGRHFPHRRGSCVPAYVRKAA